MICPHGRKELQHGILAAKAGALSRVLPFSWELLGCKGKEWALGAHSCWTWRSNSCPSLSFKALETVLVGDPEPLSLVARLSQALGPSLGATAPQPILHCLLPGMLRITCCCLWVKISSLVAPMDTLLTIHGAPWGSRCPTEMV